MGSLAFWSAMAGAGKGWREGTIAKEDARQKQIQRDYETRMKQLQLDAENARHKTSLESAEARHEEQIDVQREGLEIQRDQAESLRDIRQRRTDIAAQEADTRSRVADAQAGYYEAAAERYTAMAEALNEGRGTSGSGSGKRWTVTKSREKVLDPETRSMKEIEMPVITDNRTGLSFAQEGDRMKLLGSDKNIDAPQQDIEALIQNPDAFPRFAKHYGWLPMEWFLQFQSGQAGAEYGTTEIDED